jgi:uncharacterized protein YjbI with pentapeptide repeats
MTFAPRTFVFPEPNTDFNDTANPKYVALVSLSKEALRNRWLEGQGAQIAHILRSNKFARNVIEEYVGKINGQFDLRGLSLRGENLKMVDLSYCDLFSSDLSEANFYGSDFRHSYLSECDINGTQFDWCKMDHALVDSADFNVRTSFQGVDLNQINFNLAALLREAAISQQIIQDLERNHKVFAAVLRLTSNYGRSFTLFASWCVGIVVLFAVAYWSLPLAVGKPVLSASDFWSSLYFSVMAFATLGFAEVQPTHLASRLLVIVEVVMGYFMFGLLIAILGRKVLR